MPAEMSPTPQEEGLAGTPPATPSADSTTNPVVAIPPDCPYLVIDPVTDPTADPDTYGYYDAATGNRLTNYTLQPVAEERRQDGDEVATVLRMNLHTADGSMSLTMAAADMETARLVKAVSNAGGVMCRTFGTSRDVRDATKEYAAAAAYARTTITTDHGWDSAGREYRTPGGVVTATGFRNAGDHECRVDLTGGEHARHLGLRAPPQGRIDLLRHVVADLLRVHDASVTLALLAAAGAAVLFRFAGLTQKPVVMMSGKTGSGKTFTAQLFACLFGDFAPGSGRTATFSSTPNSLEREGFLFKDAVFLIDDHKRENVAHPKDLVRLVQNYADGTAVGRMQGGGSLAKVRPVRGLIVATGEEVPDRTPSNLARTVVFPVPEGRIDTERGACCLDRCADYPAVTAGLIQHLLAADRLNGFAGRVTRWRDDLHATAAGMPNALRVANNCALLAASLDEWANYLRGDAPEFDDLVLGFLADELPRVFHRMVTSVNERQAEKTFLSVLADMLREDRVGVLSLNASEGPVVGEARGDVLAVSIPWALTAVNGHLAALGRPPLTYTHEQLLLKLRDDGTLADEKGRAIPKGAKVEAKVVRIGGKPTRSFYIRPDALPLG